jgi:leucyl-tRNA synthetase
LGHKRSIFLSTWPKWDKKLIKEEMITLVIQVNGKVRDKIEVEADISEERAKEIAISSQKVKKWIGGKEIKRIVFVPKKLINIVV